MSIAFSRSLRSLNQDNFRSSLAWLAIGLVLLSAWSAWFFLAKIPLYEISRELQVRRDGTLLVAFPPGTLGQIRPRQTALLRLIGSTGQAARPLHAVVMDIPEYAGDRQVEVYVFSPEPLSPGVTGELRVEVERVSPAVRVMRAAGQMAQSRGLAYNRGG